jgi:hypothetical protein
VSVGAGVPRKHGDVALAPAPDEQLTAALHAFATHGCLGRLGAHAQPRARRQRTNAVNIDTGTNSEDSTWPSAVRS